MDLCGHDRKHLLDQNTYILYNLCAPLSTLCDGLKNASACLKGGRDFILGEYYHHHRMEILLFALSRILQRRKVVQQKQYPHNGVDG